MAGTNMIGSPPMALRTGLTPESYVPGNARVLSILISAATVMTAFTAGCSSSAPGGPREGRALRVDGPEQRVIFGIVRAAVGDYYRFAFPVLTNSTSRTVALQSADLTAPGKKVDVVSYSAYSVLDAHGRIYSAVDERYPGTRDPVTLPKYAVRGITIAPGERSPYVVMVRVKLIGTDSRGMSGVMSGCRVTYRVGGALYEQDFRCRFRIGE